MKKTFRFLSILFVLGLIVGTFVALTINTSAASDPFSGSASTPAVITAENYEAYGLDESYIGYYAITNADELYGYSALLDKGSAYRSASAVLLDDIIFNEGTVTAGGSSTGTTHKWNPLAYWGLDWNGTFDGRGHYISGLYVNWTTNSYAGLFAHIEGGTVKDVILKNSYFRGELYVGGIVGIMRANSTINNCRIEDSVTVFSENTWIGGVAGRSRDSIISNCYVAASVSGERTTGAITGESTGDTLSNNYYIQGCTTASGYPQNAVGRNNREGETTPDVAGQNTGLANSSATHTHIDLEHNGKDATCTEDGVYTYSDCLVCGTFLSGKKGVMPAAHKYEDGTCTACGNVCDHGGAPSTVYDNKDGTHIDKYDCCDLTVYFGDHILDADGFCTTEGCGGYQPAVLNGGTYEISTSGQLYWFADKVNNGETGINAVLTQNITVNENLLNADGTLNESGRNLLVWIFIGNQSNQFVGTFDGKGYEISGLFFNNESGIDNVGLFGFVGTNGTVKNVGVVDTYFNARDRVGGVVGANNGGTVMNCYNIGIVIGRDYVGGVAGINAGTVTNCYYLTGTATGGINKADVTGQAEAKTAEQFASGEVAYLLGSAFGQKLGENGDKYPVAVAPDNSNKVYYGYLTCADEDMVYTNNSSVSATKIEHTLAYSASGSTITATCSEECGFTATATLSAENTTYDGTAKTATVTYSEGWTGGNVTVSYVNNANAGTATASITLGEANVSVTFTIAKADLTVTANDHNISYGDAPANSGVSYNGFVNSEDESVLSGSLTYSYNYVQNDNVGSYTITPTGLTSDNYEITFESGTLTVAPKNVAEATVTLTQDSCEYNGAEQKPELTVTFGEKTLVPDKDYTFSWYKNGFVNADTYTVTITGIGNYQGTVNKSYQITPKPLLDSDISIDVTEATYNGNAHTPVITVKDGEKALLDETDYEISWNKNGFVNADTYTATITGKGNYSGSFTRTLVINKAEFEIELSSPIPSVLPGNHIALTLNTNSDATPVWTITGGAQVSGAIIKINDGLVIGQDQVTITVTYEETTNVKGGSKTITLEVGMADFSEDIAQAKEAITAAYEKAIADAVAKLEDADKNDSDALAEAIKDLEALIDAAEEAAIAGDNTLLGKIAEAITKAEDELKAAKESLEALISNVQSNLDKAKAELEKAIADLDAAMKQGDADLSAEIARLNTALANAKAALEKADADNKAELVSKIETADATLDAAIKQVQKNLDDAKAELDTAIKNGDIALDEKITDLNTALDNAITALKAADAANKSELEGKITSAQSTLQAAIDEVASDLAAAEKALADAISKGDAALSDSISSVSASLSAAKSALEKADAKNKAALEAKIADAEATLDAAIKAVQKNLDDAKTALEKALADGDKANADALAQAISDLNAAIDAAETAAVTADGSLKSELTSKIDNADAALEAAIEALAGELDTVKNALEARDNELQTFIIIVCVISSVALCGSGAFVVWFFIDRKKRI